MKRNILITIVALLLSYLPTNLLGYSYEYLSTGFFESIHVLTVDPKEHAIVPVKALGEEVSRETVATMARRYGALAAINGGFFKDDGSSAGILKINGAWYGTPYKPRGAIGWTLNGQRVLIDRLLTNCRFENCIDKNAIEVIPASSPPYTSAEDWKEVEHIVGGTPVLVRNGEIIEDFSPERTVVSFRNRKHPRTAIGIKPSGEWVFVVVDGRFYGFLGGMTISEMAELMFQLGCVEALNIDGGGSSTMFLEGLVINHPCGEILEEEKQVREVSDAILIFPATSF